MLGGGYHFMQFDGKYKDTNNQDAGFNYHAIRAVDRSDPDNLVFEDTSFEVDLGTVDFTNNATIEVKINIAEWFKNPNTWDLNELNTVLMPNFEAQKLMSANGKSVFSLGEITSIIFMHAISTKVDIYHLISFNKKISTQNSRRKNFTRSVIISSSNF